MHLEVLQNKMIKSKVKQEEIYELVVDQHLSDLTYIT